MTKPRVVSGSPKENAGRIQFADGKNGQRSSSEYR